MSVSTRAIRPTSRARGTARAGRPAAGLPHVDDGSADERMAELELRLARLETTAGLRDRGRDLMARVIPPEAGRHFRNAGREQLLGVRSIVDFWIQRIDTAESRAAVPNERQRIEVD